jgi:hypothetical protein
MYTKLPSFRSAAAAAAVAALMITAGLTWGRSRAAHAEESQGAALPKPDPDALWTYLNTKGKEYWRWETFPKTGGIVGADEFPHGDWVRIYVSPGSESAIEKQLSKKAEGFSMPEGTILVKENFPGQPAVPYINQLLSLTVMYKPATSVLESGKTFGETGWYWVMYSPQGYVQMLSTQPFMIGNQKVAKYLGEVQSGSPKFCIDCHKNANDGEKGLGDYVWNIAPFRRKAP